MDLVSVEDEVDEPASGGAVVDSEEGGAAGEEVPRVGEAMELRTEKSREKKSVPQLTNLHCQPRMASCEARRGGKGSRRGNVACR